MRLFSGLDKNQGFLHIYNSTLREWSWICDQQFTRYSGSLACQQLQREHRNALIKSVFYYTAPWEKQPIWNQTFICKKSDQGLDECDTFANYQIDECRGRGEYIYFSCNEYSLDKTQYESAWGGIRFVKPYFEPRKSVTRRFMAPQVPIFIKDD